MNDRYSIEPLYICAFDKCENGVKLNLEDYSDTRLCVIDHELNIAIDVYHELQYDYLERINVLFSDDELIKKLKEKINDNKRVALMPLITRYPSLEELNKANKVIKKMKRGYMFEDGNKVLSNENYLKVIVEEKENKNSVAKNIKMKVFKRK